MEHFDVGRTAVREAMQSLARSGLISVRTGERARVTQPTGAVVVRELAGAARIMMSQEGGMRHFQDARTMFETGIARRAAERATEEDLERIRRALEENLASEDVEAFVSTDVAFHYAIAESCRNPIFLTMHEALVEWLRDQRSVTSGHGSAKASANAAHRRIFEAIAARNPDAAEAAMLAHMEEVVRYYWETKSSEK